MSTNETELKFTVYFEGCKHTSLFVRPIPEVGEYILCTRCSTYRKVLNVTGDWWVRCKECRYRANTGSSQSMAMVRASAHSRKKTHTVELYQAGLKAETLSIYEPPRQMIPLPDGEIPY